MTADPAGEYGGRVGAALAYVREHGPLATGRHSVTGQIARAAGVSVERAWQILTMLEREGAVRLDMGGPKRIVRAEAVK